MRALERVSSIDDCMDEAYSSVAVKGNHFERKGGRAVVELQLFIIFPIFNWFIIWSEAA